MGIGVRGAEEGQHPGPVNISLLALPREMENSAPTSCLTPGRDDLHSGPLSFA